MAEITKQKILDASLLLFNENGIINVRLQQIADESGISVGNLAYHYNNKEAITESLITNVIDSLQDLLKQYGRYAAFEDLDFFFKEQYQLLNRYKFFTFDILEIKRNFPDQYEMVKPLLNKMKLQLERRFELFTQERLIHRNINLKNISANVMLLLIFLHEEAKLNGKANVSEIQYRRRLWDFVLPYFSVDGMAKFSSSIEPELVTS